MKVIGNNDYTDAKNYDLVLKCANNELIWGFYRDSNTKVRVSDSQFDVCSVGPGDSWLECAREALQNKFKCYHIAVE